MKGRGAKQKSLYTDKDLDQAIAILNTLSDDVVPQPVKENAAWIYCKALEKGLTLGASKMDMMGTFPVHCIWEEWNRCNASRYL